MGPRTNHPIPLFLRVCKMYLRALTIFATILSIIWLPQLSNGQSPVDDSTLRLRSDLVLVDVLPMQKQTGRVVNGLNRDDFTIFEDGVKQTVSHFSRAELPVTL